MVNPIVDIESGMPLLLGDHLHGPTDVLVVGRPDVLTAQGWGP